MLRPLKHFKVIYIININNISSYSSFVVNTLHPCYFILNSIILNVRKFERSLSCNLRLC